MVMFSFRNVFQGKKAKKSKRPIKIFKPNNWKRGQISEIWPKKVNLATLLSVTNNHKRRRVLS